MSAFTEAPVLVGADGSASALAAVELAAREAAMRGVPLRITHAFTWPAALVAARPAGAGAADPATLLRARAGAIVDEARRHAEKVAPDLAITAGTADGPPAFVLLDQARRAGLVVVGDRGLGRFEGLLAGSVATQLATHAGGPVIVVRGPGKPGGPVVVGVDDSAGSAHTLGFAAEEAELRGAELIVVHVWRTPPGAGPYAPMPLVYDVGLIEAAEGRHLAAVVAGLTERHPQLRVRGELGRGAAGPVLASWSRAAQLLVVGARGRGGFAGLLLGSVSQHLIFHAACPVAVVRDRRRAATTWSS